LGRRAGIGDFAKLPGRHDRDWKSSVIERQIVPDHREAMRVLHADVEMLVNVGGMERTDAEYRSLFDKAGFRLTTIVPLMDAGGFSVFEGVCV
jgi:hypothetical protein